MSCSLNQNVISTNQRVLSCAKPIEKQKNLVKHDDVTYNEKEQLCEEGDSEKKNKKNKVKKKVYFIIVY